MFLKIRNLSQYLEYFSAKRRDTSLQQGEIQRNSNCKIRIECKIFKTYLVIRKV